MNLTTPALLFPAISLLLLAYTNRFLVLAQLIRQLNSRDGNRDLTRVIPQINNLRRRILLIRLMQLFGVLSFIACTVSMYAVFLGWTRAGEWVFGGSLLLLTTSLVFSVWEIQISSGALDIELSDLEHRDD